MKYILTISIIALQAFTSLTMIKAQLNSFTIQMYYQKKQKQNSLQLQSVEHKRLMLKLNS